MTLRPLVLSACLLASIVARPPPAGAQIAPLTYELRVGSAVPIGEMRGPDAAWAGDVGGGVSFGMGFAYAVRWFLAPYVGFSQHRFSCAVSGCGKETDLTGTGFDLGVRWILGSGRVIPLVRTGVVTYRMEGTIPDGSGDVLPVTSHRSVGFEGGAFLSIRLSRRLVVAPGVRYLSMDSRFRRPGPGELPVRSLVADLGFLLAF